MKKNITKIEQYLGFKINKNDLYTKALTHKSYDKNNNYEKLEFLGDRVLGLVISKKLLEIFPDEKEGILDKKLSYLVNKNKCLEVAKSINLEKFILIGNAEQKQILIQDKIISDCCEALIGAIYLDQGLDKVEKFILKIWKKHLTASSKTFVDAKTKLQEYSLKKYKKLPIYKLLENSGPRHKPIIKVGVRLESTKYFNAKGSSKKDAEQKAASLLLESINKI